MKKNEKMNEKPGLSAKQQAVLDRLLKGKVPRDFKLKSIPKRPVFSPVPLSFAQKRLWVLDRLLQGSSAYNIPAALQIKGGLDLPVFERSINELIRRHESLRTIFKMENEEPMQEIFPELHLKINVIDLSHLSASEKEKETYRAKAEEAGKPFDLERGPLLRVLLLVHAADTHVISYTMHHIITDAWSSELFGKELVTIYQTFLAGKPSPLPELSIQYADFAVWQREQLREEELQKQLSYWKNILSGDIPTLELPADHQRPAISTYRGKAKTFQLTEDLLLRLIQLTRRHGCSMFMVMLAALNVLLYRYSGQDDIMIGVPIASRTKPELEDIIGYFSNTLVMRTGLAGAPTFSQMLIRVRSITSGAYDNQDLPFEKLVEELQPERYMSHNPLFQVLMVMGNVPKQEVEVDSKDIHVRDESVFSGSVKCDLFLALTQSGRMMNCHLEYSTDIFEDDTIQRLIDHYRIMLEAVAADPGQSIDDIQYISDEEKEQLLFRWNDTGREYELRPLHHMFLAQVERTPDQIAVIDTVMQISYMRLHEESGRLASILIEKGIEPGTIVGIKIERCVEMVVGLMGILTAGAAYMPIDTELPQDRVDYMLADSDAKLLLTKQIFIDELASGGPPFCKKVGPKTLPEGPTGHLGASHHLNNLTNQKFCSNFFKSLAPGRDRHVAGDNAGGDKPACLAYVIYTSGSTGKPKGVMVPHEGISNRLQWMQEAYGLTADDRVLQKTPYSFDVSVWEFFWTLSYGAALIMAKPGGHKDGAYLLKTINREKVTTIHFVPTMLNVFLEEPGVAGIRSLKRVICSGEALPVEYRDRFFGRFGERVELHNLYGPTEASVDVTYRACEKNFQGHRIPIGKPVANTQIYILDPRLKPVPIGVHGELHIAGIQLARGYLNKPELTHDKFIASGGPPGGRTFEKVRTKLLINNSFSGGISDESRSEIRVNALRSSLFGGRLFKKAPQVYRTGDLARWLPDGNIDFIDRMDFQVKVRGFRIELGEIESVLRENENLSDAVVVIEDSPGSAGKKLAAYVVPGPRCWQTGSQEETGSQDISAEQVTDWQDVFDDAYTNTTDTFAEDPTFNTAGWNSSYTGEPLPAEEMRTWVDKTVERILSLKPRKVMEIGCGTGLYLFPIIPFCDRYLGTDIANEGLGYIRRQLDRLKEDIPGAANWAETELMLRSAENFEGIESGELDLVFFNSVVQYFPSAAYLTEVLEGAVAKIKPGGHIFIGDVRSLPLLKAFHASVELAKAEPGDAKETILRRVSNKIAREQELAIDPLFFDALKKRNPRITHVEPLVKYGRYANELSKFRYDVILHIGAEAGTGPQPLYPGHVVAHAEQLSKNKESQHENKISTSHSLEAGWSTGKPGIEEIKDILSARAGQGSGPGCIVITSIPNARVREDIRALQRLTGGEDPGTTPGVDPNDILDLEKEYPYRISLRVSRLSGEEGAFDAVFVHRDLHGEAPGGPVRDVHPPLQAVEVSGGKTYTNNPLMVRTGGWLVPQLRDFLKDRLPEYMVPSYFVLLERLPVTANGKLDRKMLPEPAREEQDKEFVAPATETEKILAQLWQDILNLEQVGVNHNFFQLGGDSINAIQVVSRAVKLGVEMSIQLLFRNQTIAELAIAVEKNQPQFIKVGEDSYDEFLDSLDIEAISKQLPAGVEIEDIYPATPLQLHQVHFMETHNREQSATAAHDVAKRYSAQEKTSRENEISPNNSIEHPVFLFQKRDPLKGVTLDMDKFEEVVKFVSKRHRLLRTLLIWKNLKEPVQVVCKELKFDCVCHDITSVPQAEKIPAVFEILKKDWNKTFERSSSSPMRIGFIKLEEKFYHYYVTGDYMRMEGWSTGSAINEVLPFYLQLEAGAALPQLPPRENCYKEYVHTIRALRTQPGNLVREYWRSVFKDFDGMKPLTSIAGNREGQGTGFGVSHVYLTREKTEALEQFLLKHSLSLSLVIQGTWAALLRVYLRQDRVVYGMMTTGRSMPLPGIENMVGHTVNILPLLLRPAEEKPLPDYFRDVLEFQIEWTRHEYTQLDQIYEWLDLPDHRPLFDHYMVIQNLDSAIGDIRGMKKDEDSAKRNVHAVFAKMEHSLRFDIFPGYEYCFVFQYHRRHFTTPALKGLLDNYKTLIENIIENPGQTVAELMKSVDTSKYKAYENETPDYFVTG